jgi:hypothetical protein
MLNNYESTLDKRLREAEEAEAQVNRLGALAAEAPQLRDAMAKARVAAERNQKKSEAMKTAVTAAESAAEAQGQVPELLHNATKAVKELYKALRTTDGFRQTAAQALTVADRMDYELEVAETEAREVSMDRDPRGLAYVLAAQHGENKVKKLLDGLDPDFSFLRDCDLEDPIHRDLANFVVAHAVRRSTASAAKPESQPAPKEEPQPKPQPVIPIGAPVEA